MTDDEDLYDRLDDTAPVARLNLTLLPIPDPDASHAEREFIKADVQRANQNLHIMDQLLQYELMQPRLKTFNVLAICKYIRDEVVHRRKAMNYSYDAGSKALPQRNFMVPIDEEDVR